MCFLSFKKKNTRCCVSGGAMPQQLQAIQVHASPQSSDSSPEISQTSSSSAGTHCNIITLSTLSISQTSPVSLLHPHSEPHCYYSHVLSAFFSGGSHDVPWSARHVCHIHLWPRRRRPHRAQHLPTVARRDARVPHAGPGLRSVCCMCMRWIHVSLEFALWKDGLWYRYGKLLSMEMSLTHRVSVVKRCFYCVCWCLGAVPQMFLTGPPGTVQIPVSAVPLHSVIY